MTQEYRSCYRFHSQVKQWKKWLRRMRLRRLVWLLSAIVLFLTILMAGAKLMDYVQSMRANYGKSGSLETFLSLKGDEPKFNESSQLVLAQLNRQNKKREVILRKAYICRNDDRPLGIKPTQHIIQLMLDHPRWRVSIDAAGRVILEEQIEELPEACKERTYISLDGNRSLALFDGSPKEGKVIRTFFQLDVESMENSLPLKVMQQLYQGIQITDIEAYYSVLSTFSDFAVEVMKKQ